MNSEYLPPGITVVVPVYNSQDTLAELAKRLAAVLPELAAPGANFELILVNDGSRDASWQVITQLSSAYEWVHGCNLMRNYGQHNALLCGVRLARYDTIVTMDDDLQHPPEEIHKLLSRLSQGFDVVYGAPEKMPHSWWRNAFSYLIKRFLSLAMGVRNVRDFAAFRAFNTRLRLAFSSYQNPNVILDVLLSWGTNRFTTVIVNEKPRQAGQSGYNFIKLFQYTLTVLTGFTTLPLRFASLVGFIFTFFGFAVIIYVVAVYFLEGSVPGFPFIASLIALFSGIQLFALGLIGEYLARIFDRSMDRPPYVVGEMISPLGAAPSNPLQNPDPIHPVSEKKVSP